MTGLGKVAEARLQADRARARMLDSARAIEVHLKEQLAPRKLMTGLVDGAKNKGADLAEDAVDAVRARPIAATGVVTAIALFLAREPLMDLAGKLVGGKSPKTEKQEAKPPRKRSSKPKQETMEKG